MEQYIGVKVIKAEPEVKDGKEGYKVCYKDGYVSWSPKEAFEEAYRVVDGNDLLMTVLDMFSNDPENGYKNRAKAEYNQVKIRAEKLRSMLDKYATGTLNFKPNCSYDLLHSQYVFMKAYMNILEERAKIENIEF